MIFRAKASRRRGSVITFTTHKAGSMVLHRVLREICALNQIKYYSPNEGGKALPFERIFSGNDFIDKRSGCFGPIRFLVPTKAVSNARVILHLRDPRDVLISMFYSYCYMHAGEIEANSGYRKEVAEAGIDQFVLDMAGPKFDSYRGDYGIGSRYKQYVGNVRERYRQYFEQLADRPNTVVVSYEEMVLDFERWLEKVVRAFNLEEPALTVAAVGERHAPSVCSAEKEDIWSHKRKVTPGDHREKLKPDTICELNRIFRDVLIWLGYILFPFLWSISLFDSDGLP